MTKLVKLKLKFELFSLQLEDLAIAPKISDPRLNTAKLVFRKGENAYLYLTLLISTLVISFCGGWGFGRYGSKMLSVNMKKKNYESFMETILAIIALYALSIFVVVIFCLRQSPAPPNIGKAACLYILSAILLIFACYSVVSLCYRFFFVKISMHYFYPFSFAIFFHLPWVSLGIFSNPLWALPVCLTIVTGIFLLYSVIYLKARTGKNWTDYVGLIFLSSVTVIFYISFTWISARSFFTNEIISSFIQTSLTVCVGLIVHIYNKNPDEGTPLRETNT